MTNNIMAILHQLEPYNTHGILIVAFVIIIVLLFMYGYVIYKQQKPL